MSVHSSRRSSSDLMFCSLGLRGERALTGSPAGTRIAARRAGPAGRGIEADTPDTAGTQAGSQPTSVPSRTQWTPRRQEIDALS